MTSESRDNHLDTIFGIAEKPKETTPVVVQENTSIVPSDDNNKDIYKVELATANEKLDNIYSKLEGVLESHTDIAIDFSKSRDVEAVAKVASVMVALQKEKRESNKELYEVDKKKEEVKQNNTQNNIYVGSTRNLIDLLEGKVSVQTKDK